MLSFKVIEYNCTYKYCLSLRELTIVNFRLLDFHGGGVTKQMMEDATDAVICRCTGEYVKEQNRWWRE